MRENRIPIKHPDNFKDILDLFIFPNPNLHFGQGRYSMYVASANGVTWYDGIDRKDLNNIKLQIVSKDLMNYTLSLNNIDCNSKGKIAFDAKNMNG